jgi:hypothetical protein
MPYAWQISRMPAAAAGAPSATRSRVLINGVASSLRVLRALGALLADVNGQHASLALKDSAMQLQLLDRIAGGAWGMARLQHWQQLRWFVSLAQHSFHHSLLLLQAARAVSTWADPYRLQPAYHSSSLRSIVCCRLGSCSGSVFSFTSSGDLLPSCLTLSLPPCQAPPPWLRRCPASSPACPPLRPN